MQKSHTDDECYLFAFFILLVYFTILIVAAMYSRVQFGTVE